MALHDSVAQCAAVRVRVLPRAKLSLQLFWRSLKNSSGCIIIMFAKMIDRTKLESL